MDRDRQTASGQRCVEAMRALQERYLETVRELERNRKPTDGLLGMKGGPADDPCHDRYAEELRALLEGFLVEDPTSSEIRLVLGELYAAPPKVGIPRSAFWMLIAVQGLCPELIGRLEPADAGALEREYSSAYKRWERMPIQQKILKALQKQAKNA